MTGGMTGSRQAVIETGPLAPGALEAAATFYERFSGAVAHAIANERLLDRRLAQRREDAALWTRKAEAAFDAGEEALARKALVQKVAADEAIGVLEKARDSSSDRKAS